MPWYIITVLSCIIGVAMSIKAVNDRYTYRSYHDTLGWWHLPIWLGVGQLVGLIATAIFVSQTSYDHRTPVDQDIVSLNDGTGTTGRFFLGSGYIDSHPVFFYYTGDGFNGYRAHTINAEHADVKYTTGAPHMEAYCQDWTNAAKWSYIPFWHWGNKPDSVDDPGCTDENYDIDVWVTFYVPPGSVQQNYTLDSQ